MNKKLIIVISVAVAVVLAALILILTLGGKSKNNSSSDIDTNSSEIVSSADESSSNTETSSEQISSGTSTETNSSQTSIPSKTESTSTPTTSTNKTESKNETSSTTTPTPTTPKNYIEKMGLQVITINDNYCLNKESHQCDKTSCGIQQKEVNGYIWTEIPESERNNYLCVDAVFSGYCGVRSIIAFDKYTGTVLQTAGVQNQKHFTVNGKEIRAWQTWGGGGDWFLTCNTLIPKDYDGLMFLITNENIEYSNLSNKTLLLDEVCDLKNSEYCIFAGATK